MFHAFVVLVDMFCLVFDKLQMTNAILVAMPELRAAKIKGLIKAKLRQRDDRSCRGDKKPWKTKDMLD